MIVHIRHLAKREKEEMLSILFIWAQIVTFCLILNNLLVEASYQKSAYSINTIKTKNGDIYDCVDFYKQPSLNHPLLKNHSFYPEMVPSSWPKRGRIDRFTPNNGVSISIKLKDESCPKGTVPIRRMSKSELFQSNLLRQRYSKLGATNPNANQSENGVVYFAIAQSKSDRAKKYYGVGAILSVYNPAIQVNQYSSGEIIIKGDPDAIIVGWTVNPDVYRDNKTRFFVYTIAGESHCFDSQCGFVSIRADIPPGDIMEPISQVGGQIYVEKFFVFQDEKNGNWWLVVGTNATESIVIGFWPQKIFTGLSSSAFYVACGGEAYRPSNLPLPEMGTGYIPFLRPKHANAFCQDMVVVDEAHQVVYADDVETFSTDSHYGAYRVKDDLNVFGAMDDRLNFVIYGGPHDNP